MKKIKVVQKPEAEVKVPTRRMTEAEYKEAKKKVGRKA